MYQTNLQLILLALLSYALNGVQTGEVPRPRGVSLTKAPLYQPQPDGKWTCLDGSKTIYFSHINDDYCDCADGSDEPGTSACPLAKFHCINKGHEPKDIPSSQVQDGICDCCDGSDELEEVQCSNNCIAMGAAAAIQRRNEAELYSKGAEIRQEMISRGKQRKADRNALRSELSARIKEQELLKAEKEQLKKDAEALESEALEAFKEQQRELDADTAQAEQEPQQMRQEASLSFVRYDANKDGFVEVTELMVDMNLDRDRNGVVTVEEAKYFLDERDRMDLDTFITLAWPRIKPLKMLADGLFQPPVDEPKSEEPQPKTANIEAPEQEKSEPAEELADMDVPAAGDEEEDGEDEEHYEEDEDPDVGVGEASPEIETTSAPPVYDPETQRLIEQANQARNAYEDVARQIRETEHELKEIDAQDGKDYGPHEEWSVLDGECYTFDDREYVYTLCPFDRVSQKPRNGGAETTLGRWSEWSGEGDKKYSRQRYANGAACWNGPHRSTIVNIKCAVETRITGVSEPNRCEYFYEFETPAACDSEAYAAATPSMHDEL